jgi:predicted translin family RNA/ssDNA-binding protein
MHHASAIHLVKNYKFYKLANKDLQKYEDSFNFLQGLDYEEVNRISYLEDKLSVLQDKYDTLEENLQHPLVKLVSDITDEKNKWELADQIVIVKKSWAWKNKTNLNVI